MRLSKTIVLILPALAAASAISPCRHVGDASSTQETIDSISSSEVAPLPTSIAEEHSLELRQAVTPGAAPAAAATIATQPNPVTTEWIPSEVAPGSTPYVQVVYTQTFASVPSQAPSAASGEVGLGTITGQVGALRTTTAEKDSGVGSLRSGGWSLTMMVGAATVFGILL
ncbi:hypothetical protein EV356DRAFT_572880 [Viridothelium virens]|uniref:Uncharacterized protein n=1 Tax=Viridothelium virens TaxID=1048519 RepID=A0A6A6HMZ3_VIRVR|nr:hypothetical protein EV356DRAFT_572880 [Viridothelium virens]